LLKYNKSLLLKKQAIFEIMILLWGNVQI
jgi:hypothetical protein